jgi:predicted alpha/beta hydrolase family esterase
MSMFKSTILILPGLNGSGEAHWQTIWEKQFNFTRVEQRDWDLPVCDEWVTTLDEAVLARDAKDIVLVGHSTACVQVAFWAARFNRKIKGALLVAPSDTDASSYPEGPTGFAPMPLNRLPFPSITVTSIDDHYVTLERAKLFAESWGSELVNVGKAGHINVAAGYGAWPEGLVYLRKLDQLP